MATKRTSTRKNAGTNLLKTLAQHIEDKIEEIIKYEELHLFNTEEIGHILSHNIDKRLTRLKQQNKGLTSTTTRRRTSPKTSEKELTSRSKAKIRPVCSVPGCDKPARARGLCAAHYIAALRKGEF
ncbi:MAG: hypothetical protein NT009_13740 [Proteobacteria bacterium]|jgi:Glu-tRNA(Gln) amidotransferase subunit E-like FAD-binding protein|nr:hypothetical protein [Pseudomonadota bacterium]